MTGPKSLQDIIETGLLVALIVLGTLGLLYVLHIS